MLPGPLRSIWRLCWRIGAALCHKVAAGWRLQMDAYRVVKRLVRRRRLWGGAGSSRPITLFVSPEAGLLPFYASHVILARSLIESGEEAAFLSCAGELPMCNLKFALRHAPNRPGDQHAPACVRCRAQSLRTGDSYGLPDITLGSLVSAEDRLGVEELLRQHRDELSALIYDEIAFGRLALGEVLRDRRRLDEAELENSDRVLLEAVVYSALLVYMAVRRLASRRTINRLVFFGEYATWIPLQILARRHGIRISILDHGSNRDTDRRLIMVRPRTHWKYLDILTQRWAEFQIRPLTPALVRKVADNALFRLRGHGGLSIYSPNWTRDNRTLFDALGLSRDRKILIAYPGSTDEMVCAREFMHVLEEPFEQEKRPFADQNAWLDALVKWAGTRRDIQLVIRIHPRLAESARQGREATQSHRMRELFVGLPSNVRVVWPESTISSYNLLEIADGTLVGTSSIGLEAARFGVPVVCAFRSASPFPTGSFVGFAESSEDYFDTVEAAWSRGATLESITESFRWSNYFYWSSCIDVSDVIPTSDYGGIPEWGPPKDLHSIREVLRDGKDLSELNMGRLSTSVPASAAEQEAIMGAIGRFMTFFMTGNSEAETRFRLLSAEATGDVVAECDGMVVRRYSPLVNRLRGVLGKHKKQSATELI
jgi:hypothetical protein